MEEEITKEKFKEFYFKHATLNSGWTEEYWNRFYEREEGKRYFFSPPTSAESTSMFIISGHAAHRMIFLTEDAEDSLFDFPGEHEF